MPGDSSLGLSHRFRVVALESIVIAFLATASDREVHLVRKMAAHISPRPGFTQHRVTLHAASEVISLVERAEPFRRRRAERPRVADSFAKEPE